jgi:acetyltransferase-like isoleucine patch superfamily enzyme
MTSLGDKFLTRLLACENLLASAIEWDLNTAPALRALGREVGQRAVFHGLFASSKASIGADVKIDRWVRLGAGAQIGAGATIRENAALLCGVRIGEGCIVGERARLENLSLGNYSMVETEVLCVGFGHGRIVIGEQSYVGVRNILDWSDDLAIGDFVHIAGPSTAIWTHTSAHQAIHGDRLDDKSRRMTRPVRIGDRVYIGGNCTIYPGVTIGTGTIILPNSAVSRDIEPGVLAGGVPACTIRQLDC